MNTKIIKALENAKKNFQTGINLSAGKNEVLEFALKMAMGQLDLAIQLRRDEMESWELRQQQWRNQYAAGVVRIGGEKGVS